MASLIAAEPAKPEDEAGPHVARDAQGNVVISISDEAQGDMGIKVEKPMSTNVAPDIKGYGRVVDPVPLAVAVGEIAVADATYKASSNELSRLQVLQAQGNASPRALQIAEASALKDQLTAQAVRDKFALTWGKSFSEQEKLPTFLQGLTSRQSALVRVDLAAGESPTNEPVTARVLAIGGNSADATYFALAPNVDSQLQGRGYFFLVKTNNAQLMPGQAVVGYIQLPGEPIAGVFISEKSVVRTEGAGWVYVLKSDGSGFTRVQVSLDRPLGQGWFVNRGIKPENYIVTSGAQQLLSIEQKGKSD